MAPFRVEQRGRVVGAEVLDVDVERLLADPDLPAQCLAALEEHGVLLFRGLGLDDAAQVAFSRRLGEVVTFAGARVPEIVKITFDPRNPVAEYFASNVFWHIDGMMDPIPAKAALLTGQVVSDSGGETEFASTYAAYEALTPAERERFARLRVVHTFEAVQRLTYTDPTPEQLAAWARRPAREHPLVWQHRSGRRSLVFGATASHVVGMDPSESRALLDDVQRRATAPDLVFGHTWAVGDTVMWDNRGLVHRVRPFDKTRPRVMHRSTLVGDEPIEGDVSAR